MGEAARPTTEQRLAARSPRSRRHVMLQSWRELLFLHWKVDAERLAASLPDGLAIDTFEGDAYVGIVPFFMCGVRPRFLPAVPGLSNFLELNVRTYVHDREGVPGVWFHSLDCNSAPAVRIARAVFKLNYLHAAMRATRTGDGWIDYRCHRRGAARGSTFVYRRGSGEGKECEPESLEFFLLERYYLYSHHRGRGRLLRGQVAHAPYRMLPVKLREHDTGPMVQDGIDPGDRAPDHVCAVADVDVRILGIEALPRR